jgi:aconitate decarboxylase
VAEQRTSGYSAALGEFVVASHGADLPSDLTEWMKLLTLDSIGCGLLASRLPWTERLLETIRATEAPGPSRVLGHDDRVSAASAALVNSTAIHGFELDDVGIGGHHGSGTVSSALALADAGTPLTGQDLLRAIVTGIEVGTHVFDCVGYEPHVECGFHGPGLIGTFTAAATSAYVLGLDPRQCVDAIGHAAQFASGLMATHHGGMGKRLLMGRATQSGLFAAQLAEHGFTNVDNVFECGYGSFPQAFTGNRTNYQLHKLIAGLGTDYNAYQVNFKMWACRQPIHPALEAVRALRRHRLLDPAAIARIDVALAEGAFKAVGFPYRPSTITGAQLNLQYCLAVMLLQNDVSVAQFDEKLIADDGVLDLVSRIHVRCDPELGSVNAEQTVLEVTLHNGEHVTASGRQRGPGAGPVTAQDVTDKFRRMTSAALSRSAQDELIRLCLDLENVADARELLDPVSSDR